MRLTHFVLLTFVFSFSVFAQNKNTLALCENFKKIISLDPVVKTGTYTVPLSHQNPYGKKMSVFYWIRRGTNITKPPVVLIHGGPGGNSWRYYSSFKNVPYDGDIISIDNRNEGCSHIEDYKFQPEHFQIFRSRSIVLDLEILRRHLYGPKTKWRIFGQSRGVTIAHQYFEMFPNSLESVQTQGFAMMTPEKMINYTYYRSFFNARGSTRFFEKFPHVKNIYLEAQNYFRTNNVCLPINFLQQNLPVPMQPKVCGAVLTDAISYKLSNYSRWADIANSFMAIANSNGSLNPKKAIELFQVELNGNIYVGHMNYIMGTNGLDVASPSPQTFNAILNNPDLQKSLISEGRFVASAVYPVYLKSGFKPFTASVDMISFSKVKYQLQEYERINKRKFSFILFSSYYDTIAAPELYLEETRILSPYVQFISLTSSGHEGWDTEPLVRATIFR